MSRTMDHRAFDGSAYLESYMGNVAETLGRLPWSAIDMFVDRLHQARLCRSNIYIAGNGGSAATASHFVNDLNKGANVQGVPRFRAIGLVDNIPLLTAWSNDDRYDVALLEQLGNLARPGDLMVVISCSGNSANVVEAAALARELGVAVLTMTGSPGGKLAQMADLSLIVPSCCVEQVEDVHMFLEHALVSALRTKAEQESRPVLLLANGRGATPQFPAILSRLPKRAAVFLDRDGVINQNRADYVKTWDEFVLLSGALDALRSLMRLGLPVVVITNQSGVNRGVMRFDVADSINARLLSLSRQAGAPLEAVCWCPHRPGEGCACRKPRTGMLTYAAECLGLDLTRSFFVGDALSDIQAGHDAGCRTVLVRTGRGALHEEQVVSAYPQCAIQDDLTQAVAWIGRSAS